MKEDDLILGPYKLPLKKVKNGFGYQGAISLSKDGKSIQCHICGALKENLSLHIRQHKMTVREYREKFGLSLNTRLVSESHRNASIERMLALREKMKKEGSYDKIMRLCNEKRIESMRKAIENGTWKKGKMLKDEDLNLRGICPDQLLELIKKAHSHYGYTPSYAEFMAYYQTNRFAAPIRRTFRSWKGAVIKAGFKPKERGYSVEGGRIKYDPEELTEILALFYEENKRAPTISDHKRGFLPTWETYVKKFGSMAEARRVAGIQDYIKTRGGNRLSHTDGRLGISHAPHDRSPRRGWHHRIISS